MDGFSGGSFRHDYALPLIKAERPQDASCVTVIPQTHRPSDNRASRSDRNERIGVPNITGTLRQHALDELLASIHEYAAASPAFRPYWRRLALHDIGRFRRDFLVPEKLAFEAAVRASRSRRAA